jgi:hypothetical protein
MTKIMPEVRMMFPGPHVRFTPKSGHRSVRL